MANQYTKLARAISHDAKAGAIICSPATVTVWSSSGYWPPITTDATVGCDSANLVARPVGFKPIADKAYGIARFASCGRFIKHREAEREYDLDNLLQYDIAKDLVPRHVVALKDFCRCVQAVLWEQVIYVDKVESQGNDPVADDWQRGCYESIGDPRVQWGERFKLVGG
jgi:hypothetical protein